MIEIARRDDRPKPLDSAHVREAGAGRIRRPPLPANRRCRCNRQGRTWRFPRDVGSEFRPDRGRGPARAAVVRPGKFSYPGRPTTMKREKKTTMHGRDGSGQPGEGSARGPGPAAWSCAIGHAEPGLLGLHWLPTRIAVELAHDRPRPCVTGQARHRSTDHRREVRGVGPVSPPAGLLRHARSSSREREGGGGRGIPGGSRGKAAETCRPEGLRREMRNRDACCCPFWTLGAVAPGA